MATILKWKICLVCHGTGEISKRAFSALLDDWISIIETPQAMVKCPQCGGSGEYRDG